MEQVIDIFGSGKDLSMLQMSCRGVVVFIMALILIRISGRRSFGVGTPLDDIITLLLGAMLSRAIAGFHPFGRLFYLPIIAALHRIFCWLLTKSKNFSKLIEGDKILLFKEGKFFDSNMERGIR